MTPRRELPTQRVQDLFADALEQPAAARAAWLAHACGGDASLQREVEELLTAESRAPAVLERPALEGERIGERAGAWRLEELLASGGMGDVYRAVREDRELPWRVAVKVLKRGLADAAFVRRFQRERRTLAALAHPNVVALIDAGTLEDGAPFLAMELVDGVSIDRHCRERRLDRAARVNLLETVARAVDHAHRRRVVHGDLKPGNVLVTQDGRVKLLDFGVARFCDPEAEELGARGELLPQPSTPGYASPEVRAGGPIGIASDLFSLGVLMRELCPDADRDLAAIADQATRVEPALRCGSAADFADELRAWLERRPVRARAGGVVDRMRKLVARNRVASGAACVALLALAWGAHESWRRYELAQLEARLGWGAHAQALSVVDFLQQLALDARAGNDAALQAALDRAAARLAAAPPSDAEAEGRMRAAVGSLYLELGNQGAARPQFERALQLAERSRGFDAGEIEALSVLLERARG